MNAKLASESKSFTWNDDKLVNSLKRGDPSAADYLFESYAPRVYDYIYYHCGNHFLSEDITSETITRVIEKIDKYEQRNFQFKTWVFRIAQNLLIDQYRKGRHHLQVSLDTLDYENTPKVDRTSDWSGTGFLDISEQLAQRELLVKAIAKLPPDQKTIFLLRFVEGFDLEEVAKLLKKSMPSVKSLQHRALQYLRRELEENTRRA